MKVTVDPGVVSGSNVAGNWSTSPRPVSGPLSRFTPLGFVLALNKPNFEFGTSALLACRLSVAPALTGFDANRPSVTTEDRLTGIPAAEHVSA